MADVHIPVFRETVLSIFDPQPGENFVDATLGAGGHSVEIAQQILPGGVVLGIEADEEITAHIDKPDNLIISIGNYTDMDALVEKSKVNPISGVLFDLGLSSYQLDRSGRGFTFQKDEVLDMRFSRATGETARDVVNTYPKEKVGKILRDMGEEKYANEIAQAIYERRRKQKIETTFELVEIIKSCTPRWYQHRKTHPATKTFQALRMHVNNELENIKLGLEKAMELLTENGKLVVISFHSIEHRLVKNTLRSFSADGRGELITKHALQPEYRERKENPRARSAQLRAIKKA